ncbi:conserved protein of unknown function [Nitrospira japonica]|uniref:TonB C-terminal domain-containing protein n=1 Tax=Nitrospira japonica TaxID=1325564 RepID=A0A1W1I062_9BACT|nr:TonB family protein [Nitrospira japonica]SLM46357.1 conserved protein of unknown function [Nitrospira japonica]
MSAQAHVHPVQWFDAEEQDKLFLKLKRALAASFVLHVVLLLVVAGLRLPQHGERPLSSMEVSLVSVPAPVQQVEASKPVVQPKPSEPRRAPAPPVKQVAPAPVPVPPAPRASVAPNPAPPAPAVPVSPIPAPTPPAPVAAPVRQSIAKDILRDLQLPPDAPKLGELTPAKAVAQPQPQAPIPKVKLPDLPRIPDTMPDRVVKAHQQTPQTSLSEDQNRELEEELKKVKHFQPAAKLETPKEVPVKVTPPPQEASVPVAKVAPQTMLKASGASGTNPFWARVEAIIKSNWEPPPVDATGSTYSVVVKFRFYRNGTVKDIGIEHSSGNDYFDMAGQRAVQKPRAFPPFPSEMTEAYQDVEMVFRVGEALG